MSKIEASEMALIRTAESFELEVLLTQMSYSVHKNVEKHVALEQAMLTELRARNYTFDY